MCHADREAAKQAVWYPDGRVLGKTLGKYTVDRELGAGGMGVVYVAHHERLGQKVAVKVVNPELSKNHEVVQRFFAEAVAATRVKHSGIIQVFDYGEDAASGSAYFVMEYLEGESLAERLARQPPLSVDELVMIGKMIADTLAAAHGAGIVHRDLKPDNVFLVPDRMMMGGARVKVLDFGVAKLAAENLQLSLKTRTGSMLGTPYYMSPEQSRGAGEVDHRSDIYSLGCVLFEMACGRVPFPGQGLGEVLGAHQHVPPPAPRTINPSVPPWLEQAILSMLAKSAEARPQTMEDVIALLDQTRAASVSPEAVALAATRPASVPGIATPVAPTQIQHPTTTLGGAAAERVSAVPAASSARRGWLLPVGGAVVLGGGAVAAVMLMSGSDGAKDSVSTGTETTPVAPVAIDAAPEPVDDSLNQWIRIEPPAERVVLGIPKELANRKGPSGMWPALDAAAPSYAYSIQEHEVTWGELDPWLGDREVVAPAWLPDAPEERANLPATGVPWSTAAAYCASVGGQLPNEEEWEYAARGAELRRYSWGSRRIDFERTNAFGGKDARVVAVKVSSQDRTPNGIYDLTGNAQEWTAQLWRPANPEDPDDWVQADGMAFRAVRGLPLAAPRPKRLPRYGAAHREPLCSVGKCMDDAKKYLVNVGFRCVRRQ